MRIIKSDEIIKNVEDACIKANCILSSDIILAYEKSLLEEKSETGKEVLKQLMENAKISKNEMKAICQDTGMAIFFVEIGEEIFIEGNLNEVINEGVRRGYEKGFLRKSIVKDPLTRINTKDNTPAIIHIKYVKGDKLKINFTAKGFGSENMSAIKMMAPSEGVEGIKKFVIETVEKAGPNPCPPIIVGIGIGGNFEYSAFLAKKALLRSIGQRNEDIFYSDLEKELLEKINNTGIGPQGFGGKITALDVFVETYPTHIAGMPVAINIGCHVNRHKEIII